MSVPSTVRVESCLRALTLGTGRVSRLTAATNPATIRTKRKRKPAFPICGMELGNQEMVDAKQSRPPSRKFRTGLSFLLKRLTDFEQGSRENSRLADSDALDALRRRGRNYYAAHFSLSLSSATAPKRLLRTRRRGPP